MGVTEKSVLKTIEIIIIPKRTLFSLAGGTIIAINIPYSATPKALNALIGKILPESAPKNVPLTQPMRDIRIRP